MLNIENLSAAREDVEILTKVNLEVRPSSMILLMGPNGSGKTSLARVLLGDPEYRVTEGSIVLRDNDSSINFLELSVHERARKGLFVSFQIPVELPGVSTYEFLFASYRAIHHEEGKDLDVDELQGMVEEAAEKIGVPEPMLSRGVNEGFSGGERKKLELLQMVVLQPLYIILDEPDSGLDADSVKTIGTSLALLKNKPGVLIISHDAKRLGAVHFDSVCIMHKGTIAEYGGTELIERVSTQGYD
jgi:Fe-S cluster assembly ATP-binding protein